MEVRAPFATARLRLCSTQSRGETSMPVIVKYAVVTLVPLGLLGLGATLWGGFAVMALVWLTLIAAVMDHVLAPPGGTTGAPTAWADRLSILLALGHLALLPPVLVALAAPGLSPGQKIALFLATASFIGQVSHPNAHELIHRRNRFLAGLGALVYVSIGFGHHVSAHRLVHHRFVATPEDPNTPRMGESFWRYLPRAWVGSFREGLRAEAGRRATRREPDQPLLGLVRRRGVLTAILAALLAGPVGLAALLGLWALSGMQILLSDYIQHYGLQRLPLPSGRLEPVGPHHSWNAPKGFSSYLMMNAPSHSEHHLHPDRRYDELAGDTRAHPAPVPAGHGGDRDRPAALAPADGPPGLPRHGRRRRTDRRHGPRRSLT
jgi:alkane 1-monooxygenase